MDLWIRSQDRRALYCVRQLRINGLDIMCLGAELLGTYKTEERAIEVLDEIHKVIYINKLFNANINAFQTVLKNEGYTENEIAKYLRKISVYEMPKE